MKYGGICFMYDGEEEITTRVKNHLELVLKQDYEKKISDFEAQKEDLRKNYVARLNEELDEIRLQALEKLDSIKEKEKGKEIVKQIEKLQGTEPKKEKPVEFNIGDNVRIKDNNVFLPGVLSRKKQIVPALSVLWG